MRILIYNWRDIAHPNAGGAEVYTDRVASEWVKLGHEVTLFASAVDGQPEVDVAVGGYRVVRRGSRHGVYREARKFWVREGQGNFDLVVDEVNTRPFGCPRYVKEVPVIGLIHQVCREIWGYETRWPISWVGRYLLEPMWLSAYRRVPVITVSESSWQSLGKYGLGLVEVVPQGMSLDAGGVRPGPSRAGKERDPTFVFVGRLTSGKRPEHAIRAFEQVRCSLPNAKLWVIGSGPKETELQTTAAGKEVTFFGRVSDTEKRSLVARAHVLLVTSVREGWGLVVTEAASLGTMACTYDVPGLRDSVHAAGGMLAATDPTSLAEAALNAYRGVVAGTLTPKMLGVLPWHDVARRILAEADRMSRDAEAVRGTNSDPSCLGIGG